MNKYVRIIEQEIATVEGYIERLKGVGSYHNNCTIWGHYVTAYRRILELIQQERRGNNRREIPPPIIS